MLFGLPGILVYKIYRKVRDKIDAKKQTAATVNASTHDIVDKVDSPSNYQSKIEV